MNFKWLGRFLIAGTFISMVVLNFGGKLLISGEAPSAVVSLELPVSPLGVDRILWSWDVRDVLMHAKHQIDNDFVFIFFYSSLLIFACVRLHQRLRDAGVSHWKKYALLGGIAGGVAGVLDVVENFGMLKFIANYGDRLSSSESLVQLVFASALTKFMLILVSLLAIVALDIRYAVTRPLLSSR